MKLVPALFSTFLPLKPCSITKTSTEPQDHFIILFVHFYLNLISSANLKPGLVFCSLTGCLFSSLSSYLITLTCYLMASIAHRMKDTLLAWPLRPFTISFQPTILCLVSHTLSFSLTDTLPILINTAGSYGFTHLKYLHSVFLSADLSFESKMSLITLRVVIIDKLAFLVLSG